ncbi:Mss4-like protein [Crassisporium funariophilum]|nr:Mss4-like protein [Crassisporium funariophilum]
MSESSTTYDGVCECKAIQWSITLSSPSDARTSLCHCIPCKKWTGSAFGLTTRVPWDAYKLKPGSKTPSQYMNENKVKREFCGVCGSGIREFAEAAEGHNAYVCYGGLDDNGRKELAPKAEFFLKYRESWLKDIGGDDVFRKWEIKE